MIDYFNLSNNIEIYYSYFIIIKRNPFFQLLEVDLWSIILISLLISKFISTLLLLRRIKKMLFKNYIFKVLSLFFLSSQLSTSRTF